MEQTDAEVVRRVVAGDVEAFGLLVDRHHGRCLRTAIHLLGDRDEAEDVVQESFVRAYRHLAAYREHDRFGAWLLRIVVNQCRSHATRANRWTRLDHDANALVACSSSVELRADAEEDRAQLALALGQLGADQREAIVLRFAEELTFEEMSRVTGVGVSALKMRVQRACARLRAILTERINA